ncbi:MAG TPA: GtrA family protein [Paludibacter sp.]|nr:GtrA family protein [Paludibacter sp.]
MEKTKSFHQLVRFGIVGVSNTLITAAIIWILLRIFHVSDYISNIVGYVAGLINSYFWNRKWTFASKTKWSETIFKFILTFGVSYLFQLGNLYLLLHYTKTDPYVCQLISIVVYTGINFILNKYYTFRH